MTEVISRQIGRAAAIPAGEGRAFAVDGQQIAVFRGRGGALRALEAVCPHAGGPLADGQLDDSKIVCPLHNHMFSLADGSCLNGDFAVRTYPIREENGQLIVSLGPAG